MLPLASIMSYNEVSKLLKDGRESLYWCQRIHGIVHDEAIKVVNVMPKKQKQFWQRVELFQPLIRK
jgi:hypothetical protein